MSKSSNIEKYSMIYSFCIMRTDDVSVVYRGFRGFRANSLGTLFAMFKARVAREKMPKDITQDDAARNKSEEQIYDEITDAVEAQKS